MVGIKELVWLIMRNGFFATLLVFFLSGNKLIDPPWNCYLKNPATFVFTTFENSSIQFLRSDLFGIF